MPGSESALQPSLLQLETKPTYPLELNARQKSWLAARRLLIAQQQSDTLKEVVPLPLSIARIHAHEIEVERPRPPSTPGPLPRLLRQAGSGKRSST